MSGTVTAATAEAKDAKKVWTEADLEALPEDGYIHELVNGELVMSPKNNYTHGDMCSQLLTALSSYARQHRLGAVWDSSTGFWMRNRNCRAPDISFIAKERLRGFKRSARQFFPGVPDLAVEILAPSNTPAEITERLQDFFSSGTRLAWIIHTDEQFVEICRSPIQRKIVGAGAALDGEEILPGFQFPIADLFKEWDWD
jgi:Uma2 family endonuclease